MKVPVRLIVNSWKLFSNFCAITFISFLIGWSLLLFLRPESPVVIVTEAPKLLTPQVAYRGLLKYTYDLQRKQSCPGTVVTRFISRSLGAAAVVTVPRTVTSTEIRSYDDYPGSFELPESVFPGRWAMFSEVHSLCPTFERTDPLINFEFEVTR